MRARTALVCAGFASVAGACLFPTLDGLSSAQDAGQDVTTQPDVSTSDVATVVDASEAATTADAGPCPAPEANLVAYYKLDEGNGPTAHDCSGNGRDGFMLSGNAANWTTGIHDAGAALHVDIAGNGCIAVGSFPVLTGAMTISLWLFPNSYPPDGGYKQYIAGKTYAWSWAGWRLAENNASQFDLGIERGVEAGAFETYAPVAPVGTWTHLAAVFTPSTSVDVYVNGVLASHHTGAPAATIDDSQASFRIGCRGDNADYLDGNIDEVRVYDRALTVNEIVALAAQ